jgi:hypothetical protein
VERPSYTAGARSLPLLSEPCVDAMACRGHELLLILLIV